MLKINKKQSIRIVTVDQPLAKVVVAFLVENRGEETIISEPRIIRVIPKGRVQKALPSAVASYFLSAPKKTHSKQVVIVSPFFQTFTYTEDFVMSLAARPPTF